MSTSFHAYKKLKSGDLSLLYKEGEIRQVCLGKIQVLNAIYAAVRDQNWTTVPFKVREESINTAENGFCITLTIDYFLDKISYAAWMSIEAKDNKLEVNYKGEAENSFLRNRIGLCILHPINECRAKSVLITHPDGSQTEDRFPELISPHQPFFNISGMQWKPLEGIDASLSFEGEIFEAEDQRNWTDASYKTYCTPLDLPFPVQVKKGEQEHQAVTLVVKYAPNFLKASAHSDKRTLSFHSDNSSPLPGLGIGRTSETEPLSKKESGMLRTLPFHHYRVDLHLNKEVWKEIYHAAATEQAQLAWPLELAIHFGTNPDHELEAFLEQYRQQPVKIRQVLVFDQDFLTNSELLKKVVPGIKAVIKDVSVGGGTDANFAELNRNSPDPEHLDFLCYSICPQLHAFDNLSLMENLEAQADSVESALNLLDKPVSISYITLKQRFNAVATDDGDVSQAKPESDPRQHSSFIAGWTLSSIRNLALAGAASLTYFETVGPRGILSRQDSAELHSPLFQLFKEVLKDSQIQVISTKSSHPMEFDCLALQGQSENKLLLTNYTETELTIEMSGIPGLPRKISLKPSEITKITYTP